MGDMADYYVDLALNAGEGFAPRYRERRGNYGPRYSRDLPKQTTVQCDRCSASCFWGQSTGRWRLYERGTGEQHQCQGAASTADGFDDCEPQQATVNHSRSLRTGAVICKCGQGYGSERDGLCTRCRPQSKRTYTDNISFKDLGIL